VATKNPPNLSLGLGRGLTLVSVLVLAASDFCSRIEVCQSVDDLGVVYPAVVLNLKLTGWMAK